MDGYLLIYLLNVLVEPVLQLIVPYHGFPSIRHNDARDLTAELLSEICHNVEVEPPLNGETFQYKTANTHDCIFPWMASGVAAMKIVTQI